MNRRTEDLRGDPDVQYVISGDDVAQASRVATAAIAAAEGQHPLVVTIAACVMLELARGIAGSDSARGDELTRVLLERFRSSGGDTVIQDMLRALVVAS